MGLIQTKKKEVNRLIMSSKKYQNRAKEGSSWALNNIKYWWMQRSQTKLAVLERTFFFKYSTKFASQLSSSQHSSGVCQRKHIAHGYGKQWL